MPRSFFLPLWLEEKVSDRQVLKGPAVVVHPKSWTGNSIILLEGRTPELRRSSSFQFNFDSLLVVVVDVVSNSTHKIPDIPVFGFLPIEHLALQYSKEVLHKTVIHTVSLSGHALYDTVLFQAFNIAFVLILPSLIRV